MILRAGLLLGVWGSHGSTGTARAAVCETYGASEIIASLKDDTINESSGVAWYRSRSGMWITHNDAGGDAELYTFSLDNSQVEIHEVIGATFTDWEDIAAGPCPSASGEPDPSLGSCFFIGDIGDNSRVRDNIVVYAVPEPAADSPAEVIARWTVHYPDEARNSETLIVHPCTGRIYVVTKEAVGPSGIYQLPQAPDDPEVSESAELSFVGELEFRDWAPPKGSTQTTGGDWAPDGNRLVIRTYGAAFEWRTDPFDPDAHWGDKPLFIELPSMAMGEAIAYDDGTDIIITHEGAPMVIGRVPCESALEVETCVEDVPIDTGGQPTDTASTTDTTPTGGNTTATTGGTTNGGTTGGSGNDTGRVSSQPTDGEDKGCGCGGGPAAGLLLFVLPAALRRRDT